MNLIFNMLLPFVTMGVMNYLIYQAMSKSRRQQQAPPATRASVRGRGGANQINAHAPFLRRSVSNRRQSSLLTRSSSTSASVATANPGSSDPNLRRSCESVLRKRETRITRASIAITVMFVVCHLPRCIPNIMEIFLSSEDSPRVRVKGFHNIPTYPIFRTCENI